MIPAQAISGFMKRAPDAKAEERCLLPMGSCGLKRFQETGDRLSGLKRRHDFEGLSTR